MSDEWRVEVDLDDEQHGMSMGERLRSLDLDDEARERLGRRVMVTRDGPRLFAYATSEAQAREAERVIAELLRADELTADVRLTRWHDLEEAWRDAAEPLPQTAEEREAARRRHDAAEAREAIATGEYEWEVRAELSGLRDTLDLARRLEDEGLPVERHWRYLLVGAVTEEQGRELAERVRAAAPEGTRIDVEPSLSDLPTPSFVVLGARRPGIARDLGL